METLKSFKDSLDKIAACIDGMGAEGPITQAEFDALGAQALAILAACEAKHPSNPPVVNAGADVSTITLPEHVNLSGSVTPSGAGSVAWSKVSGPGNVSFDSPASLNTVASFDQLGTYVLRLTYTDGIVKSNDVTIQVN